MQIVIGGLWGHSQSADAAQAAEASSRSRTSTAKLTESMCIPHPAHEGRPQELQTTLRHILIEAWRILLLFLLVFLIVCQPVPGMLLNLC